jgi:uncharacterized protein involved in exopolysaccharide biosynthesis
MNRPQTIRQQADRLLALLRHAARFWGSGLFLLLIGMGIAMAVAVTRPRIYRSEALILYQERIAASALGREEGGESARRVGLRLRELVLSRTRLEQLIKEFDLYPQTVDERGMAEAVDLMRTKVGFKAREGDTYALSFEAEDPQLVQTITARLTDALVAENKRSAVDVAAGTKQFLDAEAQRIEDELKKRESRLAKFLSEHPAFATEQARQSGSIAGVAATDPKKAGEKLPRHRSNDPRIDALEREAERIQARLLPQPPPAPTTSPEAKEMAEEWGRRKAEAQRALEAAQRDLADKRQTFTDEHPDVKQAKGRVDAAMRLLDEVQLNSMRELARLQGRTAPPLPPPTIDERQRLQEDLVRIQLDLAHYKAAARKAETGKPGEPEKETAVSEADNIVKLETTWVQLSREVTEAQDQRREVEAKRFTADIRDRMQSEQGSNMQVIDAAYKPTRPVRGGRTQAGLIGGGMAVAVALLMMLLRALLDDRVYNRDDLERLALLPLFAAVPRPDRKTARELERARKAIQARQAARPAQAGQAGDKVAHG